MQLGLLSGLALDTPLAYLGLEELLKGYSEHWMAFFGPLIVLMALAGRRGIAGWLQTLDKRREASPPQPAVVERSA